MQTTTAECPACKTSQPVEFEGMDTAVKTEDCAGCGVELCENCEQFTCTGCDEVFCAGHLVKYDGEEACPMCALWWAQEAKRNLAEMYTERAMAQAMRRAS